jgi:L-amino acid N-acyltransferase YncA
LLIVSRADQRWYGEGRFASRRVRREGETGSVWVRWDLYQHWYRIGALAGILDAECRSGHPTVVVEEDAGAQVVAFASTSAYCPRRCYGGVAKLPVYVTRRVRGRGAGRFAMEALIGAAEEAGFWKLLSRVLRENAASRTVGFREVGIYEKHARLDGEWRDVVIVERLITAKLAPSKVGPGGAS